MQNLLQQSFSFRATLLNRSHMQFLSECNYWIWSFSAFSFQKPKESIWKIIYLQNTNESLADGLSFNF
ncbi:unnamed protein product [Caenorhabditis nigoni]